MKRARKNYKELRKEFVTDVVEQTKRAIRSDRAPLSWMALLAMSGIVVFLITKEQFSLHIVAEILGAVLVFLLLERKIERVQELDGVGIKTELTFPREDFIGLVGKAKKIRIHDFSLITLLHEKPGDGSQFLKALSEALSHDAEIEIFMARPSSEAAKARREILGRVAARNKIKGVENPDEAVRETMIRLQRFCREVNKDQGKNIVLLYDDHPSFALYQVDETLYVTFYSNDGQSTSEPQLVVNEYSPFGSFLLKHISDLKKRIDEKSTVSFIDENINHLIDGQPAQKLVAQREHIVPSL